MVLLETAVMLVMQVMQVIMVALAFRGGAALLAVEIPAVGTGGGRGLMVLALVVAAVRGLQTQDNPHMAA